MISDKFEVTNILGLVSFGLACIIAFYHLYFMIGDAARKGSSNYINWMSDTLEKMFIKIPKPKCFIIVISSTALFGLAGFFLTMKYGILSYVLTISAIFVGWNLPRFYISFIYNKRIEKFNNQLVDTLTLMSSSLKSNLNLHQVIAVVFREMPAPISQEFGLILSQHQLGLTIDEALEKMMNRIPSEDLTMVINSILILREKGGDISETFDTIAHTIRERRKVEGKIRAITAQGKMQSFLLFIMPFAVGAVLYGVNPETMELMFTTETGWVIITIMLMLQTVGGLWLRKIIDIKV